MKELKDYVLTIPDFPEPGIMFRDITSVLQDADGLRLAIDTMTDIIASNGSLIASSVFEEDKDIIGFRYAKISEDGFHDILGSTNNYVYKYNLRDIVCFEQYANNGYCRREGTPVLLYPTGEYFVAGVTSSIYVDDDCLMSEMGAALVIRMDDPENMNEVQVIRCGKEIKFKELAALPDNNEVATIVNHRWHEWFDSSYTTFQFVRWGYVPIGQSYQDFILRQSGGDIQSIDRFKYDKAILSGRYWSPAKPFDGIQRDNNLQYGCFTPYSPGYLNIYRTMTITHEMETVTWDYTNPLTRSWLRIRCTTMPVTTTHCSE